MDFNKFDSAGYMINLCARLISQRMAEALGPLGVAPGQLPVLFTLSALGQSTQRELAELGSIEQPTMALTLRRMERDGLIERSEDPADRRRAIVQLTEHARKILPQIEAIAVTINNRATEELIGGQGNLLKQLEQVAENLKGMENMSGLYAKVAMTPTVTH